MSNLQDDPVAHQSEKRCKACYHPRPQNGGGYAVIITSLDAFRLSECCATCPILAKIIEKFMNEEKLDEDAANRIRVDFQLTGTSRSLSLRLMDADANLSVFCSQRTPWLSRTLPDVSTGNDVPRHTSSDDSLQWLSQRLRHCSKSHEACSAASSDSNLPKRVLDVGNSSGEVVRLREPSGENAPYICLSHCWGPRPFLSTLSTNIDAHKLEVPWDQLPLTFQEAISLVRRLGISYLWIDSLCIVQDDQHDWRREAAKMAAVFQNAYLVITAAKSTSAYDGLFAQFPSDFRTHTIQVSNDADEEDVIHFRRWFSHTKTQIGPAFSNPSLAFPTLKRGWILQERFLAPRVVHFGSEELSWECLEESTCQCTEERSIAANYEAAGAPVWLKHMLERSSRPKSYYNPSAWRAMSEAELEKCWHRLVEDYTSLSLTFEKDIFPAISGLANQFQTVTQSPYLAGLWRKSLVKDLLWHVDPPTLEDGTSTKWMTRPREWRAPTWSWASVAGSVQFIQYDEGVSPSCEVLSVECDTFGLDPTGELTDGHLCLRGTLIPSVLKYKTLDSSDGIEPWRFLDLDILHKRLGNVWADYNCMQDGPGYVAPGSTVHCLVLGHKMPSKALCCLVLKHVGEDPDLGCRAFERIGLLELFGGRLTGAGSWLDQVLSGGEETMVKID